jgi:hypothetical protein
MHNQCLQYCLYLSSWSIFIHLNKVVCAVPLMWQMLFGLLLLPCHYENMFLANGRLNILDFSVKCSLIVQNRSICSPSLLHLYWSYKSIPLTDCGFLFILDEFSISDHIFLQRTNVIHSYFFLNRVGLAIYPRFTSTPVSSSLVLGLLPCTTRVIFTPTSILSKNFFCGTGVWTQDMHLEPHHYPFLLKGFFFPKVWSCELCCTGWLLKMIFLSLPSE